MVTFRAMREDDVELVAGWLSREHIRTWWSDPATPAEVAAKYLPRIRGEDPTEMFIVHHADRDIGLIQRYRIADHPEWLTILSDAGFDASSAAGIDYLVGEPDLVGRGVGTGMIQAFTERLFDDLADVSCVAVTPQSTNVASCRVLEKAGYRLVWTGDLDSDDPSDDGESALYVRDR